MRITSLLYGAAWMEHIHVRLVTFFFPVVTSLSALRHSSQAFVSLALLCLAESAVTKINWESFTAKDTLLGQNDGDLFFHYVTYFLTNLLKLYFGYYIIMTTETRYVFYKFTSWSLVLETFISLFGFACLLLFLRAFDQNDFLRDFYRNCRKKMEHFQ